MRVCLSEGHDVSGSLDFVTTLNKAIQHARNLPAESISTELKRYFPSFDLPVS